MTDLSAGSEFAGHRLEEQIGRGGMGVVYRATDLRLKRIVALKVVAPELAADSGFRARFEREAEHAAAIDHPNVISVFSAGEHDDVLFVTMRYVEGTDLDAMITEGGRLEPPLAAEIASQVAAGLGAAHDHGLVHRDVKPANVLIRRLDGSVHAYVTDFGLAKARAANTRFTATGMFVGTTDYIAPEQLEGKPVDSRADIYALGGVLCHMLTGEVPYPRDNEMAKLYAHGSSPPPVPSERVADLPPALDEAVAKAMANDPDERFQTTAELNAALRSAVADGNRKPDVPATEAGPVAATMPSPHPDPQSPPAESGSSLPTPVGVGEETPSTPRRARTALVAIIATIVVAATAVAIGLALTGKDSETPSAGGTELTQEEWLSDANAICADTAREFRLDSGIHKTGALKAANQLLAANETLIDRLQGLPDAPSPAAETGLQNYIAVREEFSTFVEDAIASLESNVVPQGKSFERRGATLDRRTASAADDAGLKSCRAFTL